MVVASTSSSAQTRGAVNGAGRETLNALSTVLRVAPTPVRVLVPAALSRERFVLSVLVGETLPVHLVFAAVPHVIVLVGAIEQADLHSRVGGADRCGGQESGREKEGSGESMSVHGVLLG
jgi:hypothetical protein